MDDDLHELQDSQDWERSRMLVFFILRQLNDEVKRLRNEQIAVNIKLATWGALGGLIGGAVPLILDTLRHITFK